MAKGPLKEEERKFILKKTGNWTIEQIAEELDRSTDTIEKFLGREQSRVVEDALPDTGGAVMTKALSDKGDDLQKKQMDNKKNKVSRKSGLFVMDKNKPIK